MKKILPIYLLLLISLWGKVPEKVRLQNQEVIRQAVASLSTSLPKRIDAYTQLIAITEENQTLAYTFTIESLQSDTEIQKHAEQKVIPRIRQNICQSSRRFIESDIRILYRYQRPKNSKTLFTVTADRAICDYGPLD